VNKWTSEAVYDADEASLEHLKHMLAQLGCRCAGEPEHPAHAHVQHEHQKAEGHDHHAMMEADFRRRFWVVLALTLPVLLLSPTIQEWDEAGRGQPGADYVRQHRHRRLQRAAAAAGGSGPVGRIPCSKQEQS